MHRRDFIKQSAALLAVSGCRRMPSSWRDMKKRVGLIGSGWYGKSDLLRLVQVAPVEVVSLCDVDKQMVADAADLVATRQLSKKRRAPTATTARCSRRRDLDIVLDRHARPLARAADDRGRRSRADVWVQKPISVDIVEGQAMLAAARKYKRVVQVGTQRRSTPHLIEARDRIIKEGKLGTIGYVEIYCYYHMRATQNPPDDAAARESRLRDVDRPGADAAVQLARPSAQLAGVHGVRQRHRRRHVHPHARHGPLDARPRLADAASSSTGGILVDKKSKANITDTQTATLRLPEPQRRVDAPLVGQCARPEVSVGRDVLRRQGHAQGERQLVRLHPAWRRAKRRFTRTSSWSSRSFRRTRPRRTSSATSRRRFAAT